MYITKENARDMQRKGEESKKAQLQELRAALSILANSGGDEYRARRAARVRQQLDRIDAMMMTETDPQKLDRLASAQARLAEQERLLVGRPLPGSLKPSTRGRRTDPAPQSDPEPTESTPPVGVPETPQNAPSATDSDAGI